VSPTKTRIQYVTAVNPVQVDPSTLEDQQVIHYSIPVIQETGGPGIEIASDIASSKWLLQGGEVLVSKLNVHKNCVAIVGNHAGATILASTEFVAFTPISIEPRFLKYIFQSEETIQQLSSFSESATRSHARVNPSDIIKYKACQPPLETQRLIADYLDRETARIDALVAEKEKMLALLEEKRAALISRAVTRGLDPNVPLKPSGLDWLGDIPAHWETRRLKYLTHEPLAYGANEAALEDNPDWPRFVRITDINEDGTLRDETFRSLSPEIAEPYLLEKGDVLFARSGATVGKTFIYRPEWGEACFAGYLIRFRSAQELVLPDFVYFFSLSDIYWQQVESGTIQATIQNFSAEKYAELIVCLPPPSEQKAIVDFLINAELRTSKLLAEIRNSLERLKERRAALITAAVTGQIPIEEMSA
jgi:restriction endonuclease S subunit